MNVKSFTKDQLIATAIQAVQYVAGGKAVVKENAKHLNCSEYDAEKAMIEASAEVVEFLQDWRLRDRNRRLRKMKQLAKRMEAFRKQVQQ